MWLGLVAKEIFSLNKQILQHQPRTQYPIPFTYTLYSEPVPYKYVYKHINALLTLTLYP